MGIKMNPNKANRNEIYSKLRVNGNVSLWQGIGLIDKP